MCARVSRTELKLEPSGFTNCSFVSFSAADIERWFAQALNSYSILMSSGDILERAFLGEGEPRQTHASVVFGDLHAYGRRIRRGHLSRTKNCELGENFVVKLRYQIVLSVFVFTPNLPKLDGFHRHVSASDSE